MKKKTILFVTFLVSLGVFGCGNAKQNANVLENGSKNEISTDELLDSFINGSIGAHDPMDSASTLYVTDLNMDSEDWDSYSIGEKTDLDNDGENELIINGPYGGIYLDARNNEIYIFAEGEGSALCLSYVTYHGEIWILYRNDMNMGYCSYHMEKYEGADNLTNEMFFGEELIDESNPDAGSKYTLNNAEISSEEYDAFCSKIFATEMTTN